MKTLSQFIKESVENYKEWITQFTSNFHDSAKMRFLDIEKDKNIIDEFINTDACNKVLYRASYIDHGSLWQTSEGKTCYEPVLSFTELENYVDNMNKTHAYNDHISKHDGYIMKVILHKGSKSLDISKYSKFPEQKEWIVCGKFKVIKKSEKEDIAHDSSGNEIKFTTHIIEIEQVFDEDLFEIFKKLYELSPQKKLDDYKKRMNQEKQDATEEEIIDLINTYIKKTISTAEKDRWEKKGIDITKEYLANILAKRIYSNGIAFDLKVKNYNVIPYDVVYDIATKNNIKMKGAKKFGYPELDFPKTIN